MAYLLGFRAIDAFPCPRKIGSLQGSGGGAGRSGVGVWGWAGVAGGSSQMVWNAFVLFDQSSG